jgi:glycosyltransferase involved in cell wall biosynthesis
VRKRIDQKIEARLLAQADIITTVSEEWAETLRRLTGGRQRVEVIRNGFDASEFAAIDSRRPDKWTITYVGLFYGAKQDPSAFLEALRRVIDSGASGAHSRALQHCRRARSLRSGEGGALRCG